ncbi:delta-12 fatty acid desaturase [Mycena rosella]|uniref:Delta-12 fatty acid desaturase n=1 Tax=Mycena rosella TaxID=1033263 RepID=A0AAD7DZB0_MYCRO|nr:delta-12 fatty acid desaturase [Mycena rosella]
MFEDSEEFKERKRKPFVPPDVLISSVSLSEIRKAIPPGLHQKSTALGLWYFVRDILCVSCIYYLGSTIDSFTVGLSGFLQLGWISESLIFWTLWAVYWFWQGVAMAGMWCLAHEAGHGTLSDCHRFNTAVGYILHTVLFTPYFGWRSTHHAHHKATSSIERDENYVPYTRSELGLPPIAASHAINYHDVLEETPIYTLGAMLVMQLSGLQLYLLTNIQGSRIYPKGTNHFFPSSPLFKLHEARSIIVSDIGLAFMVYVLWEFSIAVGWGRMLKLYLIPYLVFMITFLHHCDPTLPHYRNKEWTFLRGALATVDRPLMGWIGRFFFHNVSHDHIAHHIFSSIPMSPNSHAMTDNQPEVTKQLKEILGEHYNSDSTNCFRALYRSFTECTFIEDEGDIVFYKNRLGKTGRYTDAEVK